MKERPQSYADREQALLRFCLILWQAAAPDPGRKGWAQQPLSGCCTGLQKHRKRHGMYWEAVTKVSQAFKMGTDLLILPPFYGDCSFKDELFCPRFLET